MAEPNLPGRKLRRIVSALGVLTSVACALRAAEAPSPFRVEGSRVHARAGRLEVAIEHGAVTRIADLHAGNEYAGAAGDFPQRSPLLPIGVYPFDGFARLHLWRTDWRDFQLTFAKHGELRPYRWHGAEDRRVRIPPGRRPEFRQVDGRRAEIAYRGLGAAANAEIRYEIRVEPDANELLLTASARLPDAEENPVSLDLPVAGVKVDRLIFGAGLTFTGEEPPGVFTALRPANNLYGPPLCILDKPEGCVAIWHDSPFRRDNLTLIHQTEVDDLVLTSGRDPSETERGVIRNAGWRIALFRNWVEAARRYRSWFEEKTGAKPLWQQNPAWLRNIHAVCTDGYNTKQPEEFFARLAADFDPERLLVFWWNGSWIILFGDHRYMAKSALPKPQTVTALLKHGFRWLGYHPYLMIPAPAFIKSRTADLGARGELPDNYAFTPDYGGPTERFHDAFRPFAAGRYADIADAGRWMIHPAAKPVQQYLALNFRNYCRAHRMSGAYMDTLGCDTQVHYPTELKAIDGVTYLQGESDMLRRLKEACPDLAVMGEVQTEWSTARTFYTWTGAAHVLRTRLSHPLRTALWGSYTWTREVRRLDLRGCALMGTLPELDLTDEWSRARCRLFMDEELFNDLPDGEWGQDTLAHYRGRDGKRFAFKLLPFGDAYVEITPAGETVRLGRLSGRSRSDFERPVSIRDWIGYDARDRCIGLNPAAGKAYPFLCEAPPAKMPVRVLALPDGVFINSARHRDAYTVIELGRTPEGTTSGIVQLRLGRDCLRISDASRDATGPLASGRLVSWQTEFPGGVVLVWAEPQTAAGHFTRAFLGDCAHLSAVGLPQRSFTHNAYKRFELHAHGDATLPALRVGQGCFRGLTEQWVRLAAGAAPRLKFLVAYPPPKRGDHNRNSARRPFHYSVRVNGKLVWREEAEPSAQWQAKEVSLQPFAGRDALLTISAEWEQERAPSHLHFPARFGRIRIDDNPDPIDPVAESAFPPFREILIAGFGKDGKLAPAWEKHVSPVQAEEANVTLEDRALHFASRHYKYCFLSRPLDPTDGPLSLQARLQVAPTGCDARWNPGLCLFWDRAAYCFLTAGSNAKGPQFAFDVGGRPRKLPIRPGTPHITLDERCEFWLRLRLTPDRIELFLSLDGRTWQQQHAVERQGAYAAAPQSLFVGKGAAGENPLFQNDAQWHTAIQHARITEFVGGRE